MENNSKKTLREVSQEIRVSKKIILKKLFEKGLISTEESQKLEKNLSETMSNEAYKYCTSEIKNDAQIAQQRNNSNKQEEILKLVENGIDSKFEDFRKNVNSALEKEHYTITDWTSKLTKGLKTKFSQELKMIQGEHENISKNVDALTKEIASLNKKVLRVTVINNDKTIEVESVHKSFPKLLNILQQRLNVYLCGPAGSGKTTAAKQCAEALKVPFYFTGAIANEYKLTGFIDAQGKIVSTDFRKAYENGGLFLFDEIDASFPQAVLAFNAALANDFMDFPDKRVQKHENFYCIAAANTIGMGADRQYVGRNQLDAASLDRFVFLDWQYDENLEQELAGNKTWTYKVQKIRKIVNEKKIRFVVSPRASIKGAQLLAAGFNESEVEEMVLWKGMDEATKNSIKISL